MNGLISFDNFSLTSTQAVSREILELNEISRERGLVLSAEEALALSETRGRALAENERIEIGVGAIAEIIKRFSTSRYVNEEDYAWILGEITEIFYYIKTETNDKISDGDLLDELFRSFELNCRGSMELLLAREAERIIRKVTSGENYAKWYGDDSFMGDSRRDTPEEALRDEYDESLWSEDDDTYIEDEFYDEDEDITAELDAFDELLDSLASEDEGEIHEKVTEDGDNE
ncbi:MAG: hypothetical protein E7638_08225 [Ruminococcaceae bacterium]|nr:hypothetical protein [Oscillospiraceae bacterium]